MTALRNLDSESSQPRPCTTGHRDEQPARPNRALSPRAAHKRKANDESPEDFSSSALSCHKRVRIGQGDGNGEISIEQRSLVPRQNSPERTISFEKVYGTPGQPAPHKRTIVQFPLGCGSFYILRCDEHLKDFSEVRGAAEHGFSAAHGLGSMKFDDAVRAFGYRVLGCTQELAKLNNEAVLRASREAGAHQNRTAGITDPERCRFYLRDCGSKPKCPVLILPWGQLASAGLACMLGDTGIFGDATGDECPSKMRRLPKCYLYSKVDGRITGIRGWVKGYEDGGPQEWNRKFPVLSPENHEE